MKKEIKELPTEENANLEEPKKKKHIILKIIGILFLIFCLALAYAHFIGTKGYIIKEYKVESSKIPEEMNGLKIVHFSDLHYATTINNKEMQKIVKKINELKPDIVVFTGDLLDKNHQLNDSQKQELINNLKNINATLFKYAVSGNHDYSDDSFIDIFDKSNFKYLSNESQDIYYNSETPITIYGFPSSISDSPDYSILNPNNTNFRLVILHEPDSIIDIINSKPDLVLSGHSHGGQVRFPFIGAIYTPIGSKKYYESYYKINETELFISSGIGTSGWEIRFFNHPSINLYRLYSTN